MSALEHPIKAKLPKLQAFGTEEKLATWLRKEHVEKKRQPADIAKEIGCSPSRIMELLVKFEIPRIPDPDKPVKEKGAARPAEGGDKPFVNTPKFKTIIAAVDEVLGSNRYKFERSEVVDSVPGIDAVWTAPGMRAVLEPHRTESGARSSVNTLTFTGGTAKPLVVHLSSPATEKINRAAEKFMKMFIKSKNARRTHVKAEDIKPASVPSPESMSYASARHYDPLSFCETCHNMRRESQMFSETVCQPCHDDEKELKEKL